MFTVKFYVFHRKTHDLSSKPKNQGIEKKISMKKVVILFPSLILLDSFVQRIPVEFGNDISFSPCSAVRFLSIRVLVFSFRKMVNSGMGPSSKPLQ